MLRHQLSNPLQSRCSFSESDLHKLFSPHRSKKNRRKNKFLVKTHELNQSNASGTDVKDERFGGNGGGIASIAATVKEHNLHERVESREELTQIMLDIFITIFYKALNMHFLCPICNDYFRKPKMLPSCGHMFCSSCLSFWFFNSPLRSCPVCRKFTTQNQALIHVNTVSSFLEKTKKLRVFFKKSDSGEKEEEDEEGGKPQEAGGGGPTCITQRIIDLLAVLNLPNNKNNYYLIETFIQPKSQQFRSQSLRSIYKKLMFQQLVHNLRFAQRQATNQTWVNRPPGRTWLQRYRKHVLDMIKMLCPFYPVFLRFMDILKLMRTGRLKIVIHRPSVDQICMIFIAMMLAVLIFMIFYFFIQRGMKSQVKLLLHFTMVLMVNDFVQPLGN